MNEKKQYEIIKYLEKCNIVEFTQIIRKVISNRKDTTYNESNYETKLAIGEIYKELDDDNKWSNWKFSLIPEPNSEFYDKSWFVGNGEPFIQMGFCENCEIELHGHAKNSICPICRRNVYLT